MALEGVDLDRLKKFVALLSSDQPGEVAAAAAAISRALQGAGKNWHDLAESIGGPSNPFSRYHNTSVDAIRLVELQREVTKWKQIAHNNNLKAERFQQELFSLQRQVRELEVQLREKNRQTAREDYYEDKRSKRSKLNLMDALYFLAKHVDRLTEQEVVFAARMLKYTETPGGLDNQAQYMKDAVISVARKYGWRPPREQS